MENKTDVNLVRNINTYVNIREKNLVHVGQFQALCHGTMEAYVKKDALFEGHDRELRTWGMIRSKLIFLITFCYEKTFVLFIMTI